MPWTHNDNHPAAVGLAGLRYEYIIFTNAERLQQLLAVADPFGDESGGGRVVGGVYVAFDV